MLRVVFKVDDDCNVSITLQPYINYEEGGETDEDGIFI